MRARVEIIGVINDQKFTVEGDGNVDPEHGHAEIELNYSNVPSGWNPLNYSDPLVLLAGYEERDGGQNLMSLTEGGYDVQSTIDFGEGLSLRKTASIRVNGNRLDAVYSLIGSARVEDITEIEPYREYLLPAGEGQIIGVGIGEWRTPDDTVDALVSSRYQFKEPREVLKRPQIREFDVNAELDDDGSRFEAEYETQMRPMIATRDDIFEVINEDP